jgi:hypothetical protein
VCVRAWIWLVCAACGRIGFDAATGDGAVTGDGAGNSDAASGAGFTFGGIDHGSVTGLPTMTLPIGPTKAGNIELVAVTVRGSTTKVASIVDDAADSYVLAGSQSIDSACPGATEIWYAIGSHAGATKVTITMVAAASLEVWAGELTGASNFNSGSQTDNQLATTSALTQMMAAPGVPAAYIATVESCGTVQGPAGPPFTELPSSGSGAAGYYLSPGTSSARASWVTTNATYTANIIVFE